MNACRFRLPEGRVLLPFLLPLLAVVLTGAAIPRAHGQNIFWWDMNVDAPGSSSGTTAEGQWGGISGPRGRWSDSADGTGPFTVWYSQQFTGNIAAFAAGTNATGTYTVTVKEDQVIGGLLFEEGNVTLTRANPLPNPFDKLALPPSATGFSIDVAAGASGTITDLPLASVGKTLTRTGAGLFSFRNGTYQMFSANLQAGTTLVSTGATFTTDHLSVAQSAHATLQVNNAATVTTNTAVTIGANAGRHGLLEVTGTGTLVTAPTATFTVGLFGNGEVTIGAGSTVATGQQLLLGSAAASQGVVSVGGGVLQVAAIADSIVRGNGAGLIALQGGTLRIGNGGAAAAFSASAPISVGGLSTIDTRDNPSTFSGPLTGSGSLAKTGTGLLRLAGTQSFAGVLRIEGGSLDQNAATMQLAIGTFLEIGSSGTGVLSLSGGATVSSAATVAFGVLPGSAGTGTVTGVGSSLSAATSLFVGYQSTGILSVASGGTITAGDVVLGAIAGGSGVLDVQSGGTLQVGGMDGIKSGSGAFGFALSGGTLKVTNSSLTTTVPVTLTGQSTIDTSGVTATLGGVLSGTGGLTKTGGGILYLNVPNSYSGGTQNIGGQIVVPAANALGTGAITVSGGSISSTGTFSRDVLVTVDGASASLSAASFIEIGVGGSGSLIVANGGSVQTPNSVAFAVLPGGTEGSASVTGAGSSLSASGPMLLGYLGVGTVSVGSGGSVSVAGPISIGTRDTGRGTFNLNTGGTLHVGGAAGLAKGDGAATFNLSGGTLKVTGTGLTTALPMTLTNRSTVDTNGLSASLSGTLSGAGDLAKNGAGTLTLAAVNSYTGDTIVNAGRLALGISGALPDASRLVLAGGTLDAGGFSDTAGPLSLTASSSLDLAVAVSSFTFANSSAEPWTGTLTIAGFTPGVDSLRFGTDATGLTPAQLSSLRFADFGNVSGVIDSLGFVSIPEPGVLGLGWSAGLLLAVRRRR